MILTWLRDPALASFFAFLGVVVVVIVYLKQRSKKELSYQVVTNTALLSVDEAVGDKISIHYYGFTVRNVYLVELKISNCGNTSICPDDYIEPVRIKFQDENHPTRILSAEITKTEPKNLKVPINFIDHELPMEPRFGGIAIEIGKILLNKGDSFSLKMLISGFKNDMVVTGRIVGVKDIRKVEDNNKVLTPTAALFISLFFFVLTYMGTLLYLSNNKEISETLGLIIAFVLSFAALFVAVYFLHFFVKRN